MTPPRVVLDTNVVVSALVFSQGSVTWLRHEWASGRIRPLISRPIAAELIRVLEYPKFRLDSREREILLGDYLPTCEVVRVVRARAAIVPECRDPGDRMFLELAIAGKADFVVTGDADLLALSARFKVPIVTVERFRATRGAAASEPEATGYRVARARKSRPRAAP